MSTYLLAFCVGEFEFIQGLTKDGILMRILAVPGKTDQLQFALKTAIRSLDFYNEFFKIPFPLPKCDMIAVPDFSAGAMENWGLITYREGALLCDESTVSATLKQRIATVITHELAHQWFGNLVTMQWWDDLWLNEGFANWSQTFAADSLFPEWNIWQSYVSQEQAQALLLDSLRSSHPIQVPIAHAKEVEEVFDAISYCKGGSVVRMIFRVLGLEKFQEGLQLYMNTHKYSNTETTDLWAAWEKVSGVEIGNMMKTWTGKMGYPLVKITGFSESGGNMTLELEQQWFLADGSVEAADAEVSWVIPLITGTSDGASEVQMMKEKKMTLTVPAKAGSWLKLNFGQHVPVRVQYPKELIDRLSKSVQDLAPEDRVGLLSDSFALCKAGLSDPADMVSLLLGLQAERNDNVWKEIKQSADALNARLQNLSDPAPSAAFKAQIARIMRPIFKEIGWETRPGDDDNTKTLRTVLTAMAGTYLAGDDEVKSTASQLYRRFEEDVQKGISQDVRAPVLGIMVASGDKAQWERLRELHNANDEPILRRDIYSALSKSKDSKLKDTMLDWSLEDAVRSQDMVFLPIAVAASGEGGPQAVFDWLQRSFDRIYDRLGTTSMILFNHVVRCSGMGHASEDMATKVEQFWQSKPKIYEMTKKTVAQTVESVRTNSKFLSAIQKSSVSTSEYWQQYSKL
mmetsp:Transcript_42665/g.96071  ORF Transcript_42665/g.96071 Transcript_42665/m.96071 type:complete len:685 (-) Transcript_42665:104-2158(-)